MPNAADGPSSGHAGVRKVVWQGRVAHRQMLEGHVRQLVTAQGLQQQITCAFISLAILAVQDKTHEP